MTQTNPSEFFQKYREENDTFIKDYDKRMERLKKKSLSKTQEFTIRFFIVLFFFGLGAATIGTVYFSNFKKQPDPVIVTVKTSDTVKSGDSHSYNIVVSNHGMVPLTGLSLIVEYPPGFQFESSSANADNADHTYWTLKNIPRGSDTSITLNGILSGISSEEKTLLVSLHYRIGDSGAEFIAKQHATVRISEPLVSLQVSGPQLAEAEKEMTYTISYGELFGNAQQEPMAIKGKIPKEFSYSAVPAMDIANGWSDAILRKGFDSVKRSGEITLKGMFGKDAHGDYPLMFQIGKLKNNELIIADEKKLSIYISKTPLSLKLSINNSEKILPMNIIDGISATIYYENTTVDELSDVQITLGDNANLIDWSKIKDTLYGVLKDSKITWKKKELSSLDRIRPNQKGEIDIGFGLKDEVVFRKYIEDQKLAGKQFSLDLHLTASMRLTHNNEQQQLSQEPLIVRIPLQSDTQVLSSLKHIEGNRYGVEWTIQNTFHEIENINVTAVLERSATWNGKETRSAGDIMYDQEKRKIQWTLNRMPLSIKSIQASFEVLLDEHDGNKALVDTGFFEATDSLTKGTITLSVARSMATNE